MAAFVDTGTYLKYGQKPQVKAQPILWPVLVYRVLYPEVQQPKMNLFQKVVMRLIRAKTHDSEDIAQLTGLHNNLVKLIQAQLLNRGWINDQATELTESGIKVLNEEDDQSENLSSGYLFKDAVTGKLWPRIDKRFAIIEPTNPEAEFPEFVQDRKTGWLIKPFKAKFLSSKYELPSTKDALRAWQGYRSDYRASRQLYSASQIPDQVKLTGIRFQSETPESAWILLWIAPSHDDRLWSIKDPFDIRDEARWLDEALYKLLNANDNLTKRLANLIGKPVPDSQTVTEWLEGLKDQVQLRIIQDYPWARKQPDIASAISVLITRQETLEQGQNNKNDLEAAITECQKLLEVLMQWLIKTFPANNGSLPKLTKNDEILNKQLLTALYLPAFTQIVIEALSRQSLQSAIKSMNRPSSSLNQLLVAAALGTVGNETHPLKQLGSNQLQLERLIELARLRNQSTHGNSRYTGVTYKKITLEIAQDQIEYTLQFIEHFKEWINGE